MGCPAQAILSKNLVFSITTRSSTTGAPADADTAPSYSIYEDETNTAILTGTMTKPDALKTGFYTEQIAVSTANGFEIYKTYTVLVEATVSGILGNKTFNFVCISQEDWPTPGSTEAGTTVGFTTVGDLSAKLNQVAADNNMTFSDANAATMLRRLIDAYNEIVSRLMKRGLTQAEISTWVRGEEFQLDIATYWYGRDCGWGSKLQEERDWIKVFDRTKELDDVAVISNDGNLLLSGTKKFAKVMDLMAINENLGIVY